MGLGRGRVGGLGLGHRGLRSDGGASRGQGSRPPPLTGRSSSPGPQNAPSARSGGGRRNRWGRRAGRRPPEFKVRPRASGHALQAAAQGQAADSQREQGEVAAGLGDGGHVFRKIRIRVGHAGGCSGAGIVEDQAVDFH